MAIVKASWTLLKEAAKASVRYYVHRKDREGSNAWRTLFGPDGPLTKQQAYQLIDRLANGKPIYRLIIAPDPRHEDVGRRLNLRDLTERTMLKLSALSKKYGLQFLAVEHTDHSPHRHIHLITFPGRFLKRDDLMALRDAATTFARSLQEEQGRQQHHSVRFVYRLQKSLQQVERRPSPRIHTERTIAHFDAAARLAPSCPNCGPWTIMERKGRFYQCRQCGLAVSSQRSFRAELQQSRGLELSQEVGQV
jgi:ribosomal protein S27AE